MTKLRKNLAEEYLRYLSERDARKILIADLNELRYQREDMSLAQSPGKPEVLFSPKETLSLLTHIHSTPLISAVPIHDGRCPCCHLGLWIF